MLRGLAFYSHAVGSAAFPGLVLADGLGFAAPLGALAAAGAFALLIVALGGRERLGPDATTAIGLAGMLALGVILASDVFQSGSGVETLLFGSLLLVEPRDLVLAGLASAAALAATLTLGGAWLARGFDPAAAGRSVCEGSCVDALLLGLVALVVVAALSALGALLVAALVVVPAATVRLWTDPPRAVAGDHGPAGRRRGDRRAGAVGGVERSARGDDRNARGGGVRRSRQRPARCAPRVRRIGGHGRVAPL